jgi:hypothetical protein
MPLRADISFFRQRAIDRQSRREIAARFGGVCIRRQGTSEPFGSRR